MLSWVHLCFLKVLPELFHTVRTSDENLKDFITWGLGTLVSIVRQVYNFAFVVRARIQKSLCKLLAYVICLQHIRKYLPELLSLVSELWSSFTLPGPVRPSRGLPVSCMLPRVRYVSYCSTKIYLMESTLSLTDHQVLHLLEHLCLALNDEFRTYLPVILPCFIQVLGDAERFNDYIYVPDILHTLEVFGGQ